MMKQESFEVTNASVLVKNLENTANELVEK